MLNKKYFNSNLNNIDLSNAEEEKRLFLDRLENDISFKNAMKKEYNVNEIARSILDKIGLPSYGVDVMGTKFELEYPFYVEERACSADLAYKSDEVPFILQGKRSVATPSEHKKGLMQVHETIKGKTKDPFMLIVLVFLDKWFIYSSKLKDQPIMLIELDIYDDEFISKLHQYLSDSSKTREFLVEEYKHIVNERENAKFWIKQLRNNPDDTLNKIASGEIHALKSANRPSIGFIKDMISYHKDTQYLSNKYCKDELSFYNEGVVLTEDMFSDKIILKENPVGYIRGPAGEQLGRLIASVYITTGILTRGTAVEISKEFLREKSFNVFPKKRRYVKGHTRKSIMSIPEVQSGEWIVSNLNADNFDSFIVTPSKKYLESNQMKDDECLITLSELQDLIKTHKPSANDVSAIILIRNKNDYIKINSKNIMENKKDGKSDFKKFINAEIRNLRKIGIDLSVNYKQSNGCLLMSLFKNENSYVHETL